MKKASLHAILVSIILVAGLSSCSGSGRLSTNPATAQSGLWAMAYYPAYQNTMAISAIPFNSVTHAVYFSIVPAHSVGTGTFAGTVGTPGTLTDPSGLLLQSVAFVSAAHAAGVKALLGIGGDTSVDASLGFQQAMQSPSTLTSLVNNIVTTMARYGYDGVDINWESINFPGDVGNFQTFITQLRSALDQKSPPTHYLLTYPPGTASDDINDTNNANMIFPVQSAIDQINLQTYGMAAAYQGWVTWHNSALFSGACVFPGTSIHLPSVDSTVKAFASVGIIKSKIGIGIQLAGIDWAGGRGTSTGGATKPCQAWDYAKSNQGAPVVRSVSAATIVTKYTAANGYVENFDVVTMVPWLSNTQTNSANDHFVSFENSRSIQAKSNYIKSHGLGGAIIFEVSGDYMPTQPSGDLQHPLMTAVRLYVMH